MDFWTSVNVCVPDRFGALLPTPAIRFLLSVLSTSPVDMCLFSGSCGDTGKAGVEGGGPMSSGMLWLLIAVRRPIRGLGGTPAAAVLGLRPIRGLEGTLSLLAPAGGWCLASEGLAWPRRLWRAGLGGVLVATVRWRVLGLPGTVWTPMTLTWEPSAEVGLFA